MGISVKYIAGQLGKEHHKVDNQDYKIVYEGGVDEIEEKKSRFIATVVPVKSEKEAAEEIERIRKQYWDARHNCYAYIIGGQNITRCTDDGEPSGTAGRPMLEVLLGAGLHDVLVVVTRYFGGTLLGTGGLVRAYSKAVQAGLAASKVVTIRFGKELQIITDYSGIGKLQHIVADKDVAVTDTLYTEQVEMRMLVPLEEIDALEKEMIEATAGKVKINHLENTEYAVLDKEVIYRKES